ncbi:M48 family metallopeptidase [Humidesulfovibrio sp.]
MFGFLKPKPSPPKRLELMLGGESVSVELAFDRFRSIRISIRPEGLVRVRAPKGTALSVIRERLEFKAAWIEKHLERFRTRRQAHAPLRHVDGETHRHLGRDCVLRVSRAGRNAVRLDGSELFVTTRQDPEPEAVRKLLDAWRAKQARELFTKVIRELLPLLDAHGAPRPERLRVRAMKSRWGSCSRARVICLNLHLLKAPPECIEYVAAHELCHLLHHGHDARFYGLLAAIMPDWRERKRLLAEQPID